MLRGDLGENPVFLLSLCKKCSKIYGVNLTRMPYNRSLKMPYEPFYNYFPQIAENQTRVITLFNKTDFKLPAGEYAFIELYCNEKGCDCRRVMFNVFYDRKQVAAVIAYGWETPEFYAQWMGDDDPNVIEELKGPTTSMLGPQSDKAGQILGMFEKLVLTDQKYIERIKEHYRLFRDRIDKPRRRRGVIKLRR